MDKRNYINGLAKEAEQAADSGNMRQLYDTTRKLAGKYSKPERPVKDKQGRNITGTEKKLNRWAEHFEELLNRPATLDPPPDIQPAIVNLPINCDKMTNEEIRRAIKHLKNNKATGPDDIPAEALKTDIDTSVELLYPLFTEIWEKEEVPSDWREGWIPHKTPQKRRPQQLFQLQRNHTSVSAWESLQQNNLGKNER